jgi:hypothetical protein
MRRLTLAAVIVAILAIYTLRQQASVWIWDRTGTVSWNNPPLLTTFLYLLVPQLLFVGIYLFLSRHESDSRAVSLRNPKFLVFVAVAGFVYFVGWHHLKA